MNERIRKIPIGESFRLEFPSEEFGPGDTVEICHNALSSQYEASLVKQGGSRTTVPMELVQMLLRNGMLG